jgi:hypothetical protein
MNRRGLVILARFMRMSGHQHPYFEGIRANYVQMLRDLGRADAEIHAALASIWEEAVRESPS